eukprot:578032-Amphidinium_carterae.2
METVHQSEQPNNGGSDDSSRVSSVTGFHLAWLRLLGSDQGQEKSVSHPCTNVEYLRVLSTLGYN